MEQRSEPGEVEIYTDGACSGNPGPGGWAAIIMEGKHRREISGSAARTTNQQMELQAAIEGLRALGTTPQKVALFSDSAYLVNCFKDRWYERWERNGWVNAKKEPVQNRELWEELLRLVRLHRISFRKVKGHAGDEHNERADALARAALRQGT